MKNRRAGLLLFLIGVLGVAYFWASDPRFGWPRLVGDVTIDDANRAIVGTLIGALGSAVVIVLGLWLVRRKTT